MMGGSINDNILVITEDVSGTPSINDSISAITDALGSPDITTRIITGAENGIPATPDKMVNFF